MKSKEIIDPLEKSHVKSHPLFPLLPYIDPYCPLLDCHFIPPTMPSYVGRSQVESLRSPEHAPVALPQATSEL